MMVPMRPKPRTTSGKKIHASGLRPAAGEGDEVDRDAQDHGADVLGGGGLEQVGAAAGAVADVVADEVRDDTRVARVVLGDARLDLAHEVRTDVRGLGVDTTAELGEQGHERGTEAEADDEERRMGRVVEAAEQDEDAVHAEQREGDHEEARDGAATHRDLHRADQAVAGGGRGAQVGLDADEHADDAGGHRAGGADQERDGGVDAQLDPVDALGVGQLRRVHDRDDRRR